MVQRGQPATGAVVMSWTHASVGSTVMPVRRAARVDGSRCIITVYNAWSVGFMIGYYTVMLLSSAPAHQKCARPNTL
jgi:hypothetical protein